MQSLNLPQLRLLKTCYVSQAVYRKHLNLNLRQLTDTNVAANWAVSMLMGLALLPANDIAVGLEVVIHYSHQHNFEEEFNDMIVYVVV